MRTFRPENRPWWRRPRVRWCPSAVMADASPRTPHPGVLRLRSPSRCTWSPAFPGQSMHAGRGTSMEAVFYVAVTGRQVRVEVDLFSPSGSSAPRSISLAWLEDSTGLWPPMNRWMSRDMPSSDRASLRAVQHCVLRPRHRHAPSARGRVGARGRAPRPAHPPTPLPGTYPATQGDTARARRMAELVLALRIRAACCPSLWLFTAHGQMVDTPGTRPMGLSACKSSRGRRANSSASAPRTMATTALG